MRPLFKRVPQPAPGYPNAAVCPPAPGLKIDFDDFGDTGKEKKGQARKKEKKSLNCGPTYVVVTSYIQAILRGGTSKMKKTILVFLSIVFTGVMLELLITSATTNPGKIPVLKGPYLGQKPPGKIPEPLGE